MTDTRVAEMEFPGLDEARTRILRAAIECVRQYGTTKMSMADVAKASGYSRATIYKYFENRQELVDAIFTQGQLAFFRDVDAAARGHDRLSDQMAAATRILMEYLYNEAHAPWAGLLDPLDEALITRQHGGELVEGLASLASALTGEAAERGELRSDLGAEQVGAWLGRLLFSAHFMGSDRASITRAERMVRDLCDLVTDTT